MHCTKTVERAVKVGHRHEASLLMIVTRLRPSFLPVLIELRSVRPGDAKIEGTLLTVSLRHHELKEPKWTGVGPVLLELGTNRFV